MRRVRVFGWLLFLMCVGLVLSAGASARQKPGSQTYTVVIHGFRYAPANVTAKVGDTILWKNTDIVSHTVTADDGSFDSGKIAPGATWKLVAKKRGTHAYKCVPHPNMHGIVIVN